MKVVAPVPPWLTARVPRMLVKGMLREEVEVWRKPVPAGLVLRANWREQEYCHHFRSGRRSR